MTHDVSWGSGTSEWGRASHLYNVSLQVLVASSFLCIMPPWVFIVGEAWGHCGSLGCALDRMRGCFTGARHHSRFT